MKNKYLQLVAESAAAAVFCGIFTVASGVLISWYYWRQASGEGDALGLVSPQYLLFSLLVATLSVLIPLLIFNFAKLKYKERKAKT